MENYFKQIKLNKDDYIEFSIPYIEFNLSNDYIIQGIQIHLQTYFNLYRTSYYLYPDKECIESSEFYKYSEAYEYYFDISILGFGLTIKKVLGIKND